MSSFLLHQKLIQTADKFQQKAALQISKPPAGYRKYTYSETADISRGIGFYFINRGIEKRDRVAIILENGPQWPLFYFGILFAGAAAVPIDPQLTGQEITNILSDCQAKIVVTGSNAGEILGALAPVPSGFDFPETDVNEAASILYTSGTTAVPKGVELTHKNLSANFNSLAQLNICSENDNIISILPLHHSYSFMVTLLLPLCLGATVTYVKTLRPDEILSTMREAQVTILVGVPQIFYLFHKGILEKVNKLPFLIRALKPIIARRVREGFGKKLRFFVSGGARLDPKVAKDLAGLGLKIIEGYGLTETSPVVTFNPIDRQKFGSVGIPVPGVEVKVLNPNGHGVGQVLIKGSNVMKGYYKRPQDTAGALKDGWFYSGDLGRIDKDGYLFLTGREKELIVLSSGKNIYPEEVEGCYKQSPFIKEVCVTGIFKGGTTEEMGAVIVPDMEYFKKAGEINVREKIKWELERLSVEITPYKRIMSFIISKEELPKTRLGKIRRYEVGRIYGREFEGQGPGSRVQGSEHTVQGLKEGDLEILNSDAGRKITKFLSEEKNIKRNILAADHLELDLGVDSLGRVELLVGLEKIFDIHIHESEVAHIFTVRDLILKVKEITAGKVQRAEYPASALDGMAWSGILREDPRERIKAKIGLRPWFFSKMAAFFAAKFLYLIFKLVFRLKVYGRENIPEEGPFILCPNHSSYLDAFSIVAGVSLGCELNLFFLGFREYFRQPVVRSLIKIMRVIPIDPASELINSMKASSFVLRNNKALCIFPEGKRSIDGEVNEFKKGIGILAKEIGVSLIPVYIKGSFRAWPRDRTFPRPHPIVVVFGKPFDAKRLQEIGAGKGSKDIYEAIAVGLREEVLELRAHG